MRAKNRGGIEMGILYIPRVFAVFGLPHSDPMEVKGTDTNGLAAPYDLDGRYWVRQDGPGANADWRVKRSWLVVEPSEHGLPHGKWAKLAVIMLATAARETGNRRLSLGSIAETLRAMGIASSSGGETGNIRPMKEMFDRLLGAIFTYLPPEPEGLDREAVRTIREVRESWLEDLVITAKSGLKMRRLPDEAAIRFMIADSFTGWRDGGAEIVLSESFYRMCVEDEIALDEGTVRAVQRSAVALEAYAFLNARVRWNKGGVSLSPLMLARQLGAVGPSREFRRRFKEAVIKIGGRWTDLDVRFVDGDAMLDPTGGRTKGGYAALHAGSKKEGSIVVMTCEPHVRSQRMKQAADEVIKADAFGQKLGKQVLGGIARKAAAKSGTAEQRILAEVQTATPKSWMSFGHDDDL